jgi:hypothetical protein
VEPRETEVYSKRYVEVRRGEPARQHVACGMLACRSGVSAVAVEALMDNVRKEGKLELTEVLRSAAAAEGIPEGFRSPESGRVAHLT